MDGVAIKMDDTKLNFRQWYVDDIVEFEMKKETLHKERQELERARRDLERERRNFAIQKKNENRQRKRKAAF